MARTYGGGSTLFCGQEREQVARVLEAGLSSSAVKCATPDFEAWVAAPPSSSKLDVLTGHGLHDLGPVMNMYELSLTIRTKSVMAGE
jgi:hypothetical protein